MRDPINAADTHPYTDDGSDPGNCAVCHFFHTGPRQNPDQTIGNGFNPLDDPAYDPALERMTDQPRLTRYALAHTSYADGRATGVANIAAEYAPDGVTLVIRPGYTIPPVIITLTYRAWRELTLRPPTAL
jgi:hypothetical protein